MFIPLSVERLHKRFPVMTVSIIGANLAAFLVASISAWGDGGFWRRWALVPCQHGPFSHQVFVSLFLHVGWLHLLVNMWFLFIYGAGVEDACGRVRLLLLYLISGLAGQVAEAALSPLPFPVVGSGAAVSGIVGAYLVLYPRYRASILVFIFWTVRHIEVPAWCLAGLWGVVQTVVAAVAKGGTVEMAYAALLFGFVAGVVLVLAGRRLFVLEKVEKRSKDDMAWLLSPTKARVGRRRRGGRLKVATVGKEELEAARRIVEGKERLQEPQEKLRKLVAVSAGGAALELWLSLNEGERLKVEPRMLKFLLREAMEKGRLKEAQKVAQTLIKVVPDGKEKAEAFHLLGQVYEEMCDYGAAIREYERAETGGDERASGALERLRAKIAPRFLSPMREGRRYAVVRADTHATGGHLIVDVVAEATGDSKADVARRIHVCGGTYAVGLGPEKAHELATELSRLGIPTLVVDVEDVPPPPPPQPVVAAAFRPEGLLFTHDIQKEPQLAEWDRIVAINAGVIEHKVSPKREPDVASAQTRPTHHRRRTTPERRLMFALVDILLVRPYQRLRMDEKRFSFTLMEAKHGVSGRNFSLFLRRGIELAPDTTVVSEGALVVARLKESPLERVLLPTERVLDLQGMWLAIIAYARKMAATS